MAACPICGTERLEVGKTRWWEKLDARLVWRRACECADCGWTGWVTGYAGDVGAANVIEARVFSADARRSA